ncbi:MAG: sensor histidine kinase [Gammaproteobacteria bacterium]|nr:sensor histidine kinase [Gammaproteobacteria bacterium]
MSSANVASTVEREAAVEGGAVTPPFRRWRALEPYIYLCFLGFLAFEPALSVDGRWLPTLLLIAVFVPTYVAGVHWQDKRPKLYVACGAMAMLAIVGVSFQLNVNATMFLIYAAASATRDTTVPRAVVVVGLAFAILAGLFFVSDFPLPFRWASFLPALLLVPVIVVTQLLQAERDRHNARLRLSEEEIERLAAIAERERISRDLHDLLGHTLSTITLKSALAARLGSTDPERASKEIRDVEEISRTTLDQVREAVRGYRRSGLAEEISGIRKTLETADIGFHVEVEPVDLAPEQESALALALRESATNVLRHSGATQVRAALRAEGSEIVLTITDNGQGGGSEGNGLSGIRLRMQALGGTFSRTTEEGTRLTVRLPMRTLPLRAESACQP